jgi:hypothetical protein
MLSRSGSSVGGNARQLRLKRCAKTVNSVDGHASGFSVTLMGNDAMMLRVRLCGAEYVFIGDNLLVGGAIALAEDFQHGRASYAHLWPDGAVKRFGETIARRDDVTVIEAIPDLQPADDALANMMSDDSWPETAHVLAMLEVLRALLK